MAMLKKISFKLVRKISNLLARNRLIKTPELWNQITTYLAKSKTTGCNYTDYWALYSFIIKRKPKEILECGTGISTLVMAYALKENQKADHGMVIRITSMEEHEGYYEMAKNLLPDEYRKIVELVLSPTEESGYLLFRGMKYKSVPDRKYDFIFIDGPSYKHPKDGYLTFDADFLHILIKADWPIDAIIDKRVSTCYVLQKAIGTDKVKYDAIQHLGFCNKCTREDLKDFNPDAPFSSFQKSFSLFGNSHLDLEFDWKFIKQKPTD